MEDWNKIQAFMAHVVPWPASPQDAGYVNLHYSSVDRKDPSKLHKGGGWPFRSVETFITRAQWVNTVANFKDVWYCMSLQSQTRENRNNPAKPLAKRLAANALAVKALWIDMDVGEGDKKYPTLADALKGAIKFRELNGLPPYSAMVASGSGLHAYWISKDPLAVRDWAQYAEGLKQLLVQQAVKCDAGLTTDVARILRVPGTFNHKTNPPKPVTLLDVPLVMYDFATDLALIKAEISISTHSNSASEPTSIFVDDVAAAKFKGVKPHFAADPNDTLQAGIDIEARPLLEPLPIFAQCGFYKDALFKGGAGLDNYLWHLSVLGTTFMENGNAIAHSISKLHETYSTDGTQKEYDRAVAERADRGIGYPSCATIAAAGCTSCATCPLFAKGKSPLNIRPVTAAVNPLNLALPLNQTQGAKDMNLPEGYDLDPKGYICAVEQREINGELMAPVYHQLFYSKITDPWCQSDPDSINFTTTRAKGDIWQASIKHAEMGAMQLSGVWGREHVKIVPTNKARLEQFLMAWLAKLHEIAAAQKALPFGWYEELGHTKGFVYAGKLMKDDGTEQPCGVGDAKLRATFHPSGNIQDWFAACTAITNQRRPELDAIIALAFAAPLSALVGQNNMTLCAYGESGAGKTAAYSVGVSVWGHCKRGKQVSQSTFNSVMKIMGELRNLPLYWDEIKNEQAQKSVYDFVYNGSDGVEKSRMKSDTSLQSQGIWQTQTMIAANISFVDYVIKTAPSHVAGVSRVLEYRVLKTEPDAPGKISPTDAAAIFDKLMNSYGHMGLLYGKLLAMNHASIKARAMTACKEVEAHFNATAEERFWVPQVGTLIVGAELANALGCDIDVAGLKKFLYRVYKENRTKRDTMMNTGTHKETVEGIMSGYFGKVTVNDQHIWTAGMPPATAGSPKPCMVYRGPKDTKNASVDTPIAVRWDVKTGTLYILRDHLVKYLEETSASVATVFDDLKKEYKMEVHRRVRIGSGTGFISGRSSVCVFNCIGIDHDWGDMMYGILPEAERPAPTTPTTPSGGGGGGHLKLVENVETGIVDAATGLATPAAVAAFVKGAVRQ